jgi:uncharacterized protein YuzE
MRLWYRAGENALRLTLDSGPSPVNERYELSGVIDIGEQGRLMGLEIETANFDLTPALSTWLHDPVAARYLNVDEGDVYLALSAPGEQLIPEHVRSAAVRVIAELDHARQITAFTFPRRGTDYEISFPSGNR